MFAQFINALSIAFRELQRNITRTALTSLGILIGVGAVIAMVGLGQGATASIEDDLSSIGSNLLVVSPGSGGGPQARTTAPNFTLGDVEAIRDQVPDLKAVAPDVTASLTARYRNQSWAATIHGSTNDWMIAMDHELDSGRRFTEGEQRSGAGVCIIGQTVQEELFGARSPIGEELRFAQDTCTVVGTLAPKGENTMGMDQDNLIFAPLPAVQRRILGTTDVSTIYLSATSVDDMDQVSAMVDDLMRKRRHVVSDSTVNFQVRDTREMASMVSGITSTMTLFLAAVAGVSLLVGGIGIMNIMLVSVTERTREIGIRMAIGALERDVMTQFLIEAVVLAAFGGVLGVIVGIIGTIAGAWAIGIPVVIDPLAVIGAVGFSALMGVGFGWFPAQRAARMEPIDALRSV
ncbi:MAG: ABC transporter permease [Myxococcota bacterium]